MLEHVPDPESFILSAVDKLKKDGLLLVDVPNQDYLFKSNVFPHLTFFSSESLTILLERSGLKILDADIWGRSYNASPLNKKMKNYSYYKYYFLDHLFAKISMFFGEDSHVKFYRWLFGANLRSQNGTWIRVLARKII